MQAMYDFVEKWPIFSILEPDIIATIRCFCVFGNSGNEAIFITHDDDVYAMGSNCSSCLGLGDVHNSFDPRIVEPLCRRRLVELVYGSGPHVLARTEDGDIFSWGHNGYCQLGNGHANQGYVPVPVSSNLNDKKIMQIACGSHHSLALSVEGEIYAWGQNNCGQIGSGSNSNQPTPRKVSAIIGGQKAVSIACGQTSSMALMEDGELYGWGYNGNGQLGLGNNVNQLNPSKVQSLSGIIITQVVCGYAHTLALSDEGSLFSWGANSYGQLGSGNKANLVTPHKIGTDERFIEIAATHYSHLSCGMTQTGRIYMWGQCRGQSITSPMLTRFKHIDHVFSMFSSPTVTWKMHHVNEVQGSRITEDIAQSFDNPLTSDVKFVVDGKEIHVHKSLLKIRCEHFRSMFQSHWDEDSKNALVISQYTYTVYYAFLQFLYTDVVNLSSEDAIGLLDLANAYCEPTLKKESEALIKHGITVENAAMLYAASIKFQAKDLEEFCFHFCLNHLTAVTQTEAFSKLDENVLKVFIKKAAQSGAFRY